MKKKHSLRQLRYVRLLASRAGSWTILRISNNFYIISVVFRCRKQSDVNFLFALHVILHVLRGKKVSDKLEKKNSSFFSFSSNIHSNIIVVTDLNSFRFCCATVTVSSSSNRYNTYTHPLNGWSKVAEEDAHVRRRNNRWRRPRRDATTHGPPRESGRRTRIVWVTSTVLNPNYKKTAVVAVMHRIRIPRDYRTWEPPLFVVVFCSKRTFPREVQNLRVMFLSNLNASVGRFIGVQSVSIYTEDPFVRNRIRRATVSLGPFSKLKSSVDKFGTIFFFFLKNFNLILT